jgi:hypothetical protein
MIKAMVLTAIAVFVVRIALAFARRRPGRGRPRSTPLDRLRTYLAQRQDYLVYVGFPLDAPASWRKVDSWRGTTLRVVDEVIELSDVSLFVVAYPNGQVLEAVFEPLPLPEGIEYFESKGNGRNDVLDTDELSEGARFARVSFGPSGSRPGQPGYYATSLTNTFDEPFRVVRFGAFSSSGALAQLNTISGDYFSGDDFANWYGVGDDGWIAPGETVADPNNYGGGDGYWVYYCETEKGDAFCVGAKHPAT